MEPLNLLIARRNVTDQVRETAEPDEKTEPAKGGQCGPVVQVGWWRRLASRCAREFGRAGTRRRVTVLR